MRGGPGCAIVQRTTGRGLMQLCRNNLADSLSGQGKYDEAEKMQREVLAVRKRVLGAEHIDTQHTHTHKCNHRGYVSQAARATWYPRGVMIL